MRLFASLSGYRRPWLRGDLIAGLTLWAILIPQALAYASIANVSPVVGLYAAPGALLLYAPLGSSRVLVMGRWRPFVDVTAARMLVAAYEELRRRSVRLVLARAVGQVRDVLGCVRDESDLTARYPTIKAAIAASLPPTRTEWDQPSKPPSSSATSNLARRHPVRIRWPPVPRRPEIATDPQLSLALDD